MKITNIVYKSFDEINQMEQWDFASMPKKPKWYLQLLAWVLALPETFKVKPTINKHNMKGLKEPYIMLCNHNSFLDFKIATRAIFPRRSTYIVAVDGFIGREGIMRNVGCYMKRKFVSDINLVKQVKHTLEDLKVIAQIYPEARYSLVGTSSPLPDSLGKLVKHLKHPVVTLVSHGHHLRQPFWNLTPRKVRTKTDMTQIITKDEVQELSVEEINKRIREAFIYNDYQYQLENHIQIKEPFRAEGLHKPLFICPHCHKENTMTSKGIKIWCTSCNEIYEMNEYGILLNHNHTVFSHIPDWFNWQRQVIRDQIKNNNYNIDLEVEIDILPNSSGFYRVGKGRFIQNKDGIQLIHKDFKVSKPVLSNFGIHIEYDYFGRGDGISFSTKDHTFYVYPTDQSFNVTKVHFGTEELYDLESKKDNH